METFRQETSFIVDPADAGRRLDAALAAFFPGLGLRARRRLWAWHTVSVDGRPARPGDRLRAGQRVCCVPSRPGGPSAGEIALVWAGEEYCAFLKPAGLPSVRLAGGPGDSAEAWIVGRWPRLSADFPALSGPALPVTPPLLCNRLDTPTSGLLLGAFSQDALRSFRCLEQAGRVEKCYCALARGETPPFLRLEQALDTDDRRRTRVLDREAADAARHTLAERLRVFAAGEGPAPGPEPVSLLRVRIRRGARHQIRAHLARAGFPIVGDVLYGPEEGAPAETPLYLHHCRIRFPGVEAASRPPWLPALESIFPIPPF